MKYSLLVLSLILGCASLACERENGVNEMESITPTTIVSGLNHPWGMTFLDANTFLVTERNGGIQYFDGNKLTEIAHDLDVVQEGQGGLLDIAIAPDYEQTGYIYMTYAKRITASNSTTALVRFRFDGNQISDIEELFMALPAVSNPVHYGSRIAFDEAGHVYMTLGDRYTYDAASDIPDVFQALPQTLDNHWGKVVRLNLDGSIPSDNPFVGQADAQEEIYTYGHRNPQGIAYDPDQQAIVINEHGAQGGDEINLLTAGSNYGWPVITYGKDYNNRSIGLGTSRSGIEQPLLYWDPSLAPSSMAYYIGDRYPNWSGQWFVSTLAGETLVRLSWDGSTLVEEARLFRRELGRIRAVVASPEGLLYLLVDSSNGQVVQLSI
ncbi:MAG: PQQ-dependent sugar dehydrogenase [Bacteroidota bacterium]